MSANTLTNVAPVIYEAYETVQQEAIGAIPAVYRNSSAERAALDDAIRYPIVPAASLTENTPAATFDDPTGITPTNGTLTLDKSYHAPIRWSGEEEKSGKNAGVYANILKQQFMQGFRSFRNEIEKDILSLYTNASRAVGTATTTPFATTLADVNSVLKEMIDNASPMDDAHLIINSAAGLNLRNLTQLTNVNQAGSSETLRSGRLLDLSGFAIGESAQVQAHTKGTGTSYQTNNPAGGTLAIGTTSIPIDTGADTVVAGDVVTFTGDTNKYLVTTGVAAAGTIAIAAPGLKQTLADGVSMSIGATSNAMNLAFDRNAIHLVTRPWAMPSGGDMAVDSMMIGDPVSGITFEVRYYKGYGLSVIQIQLVWGVKMIKPENCIVLLG